MKLFFVVYLAGKIIGIMGPVTYDQPKCVAESDRFLQECRRNKPDACPNIETACEWHNERPVVGSKPAKA